MSKHLALPREGHLEQVLNIMGYLKTHKKMRLLFDCGYPNVDERWFKNYDWFDSYWDAKEAIPWSCGWQAQQPKITAICQ